MNVMSIDGDSRFAPHAVMVLGLLVDVAAVAGMAGAVVLTTGGLLAVALVAGNLMLVAGTFVAYRGRTCADDG